MLIGPYPYHIANTYLGSMAQESRLNITANNLANVNTPGFKKDVPIFEGYMVKASKTYFEQGGLMQSNRQLDLALSGPGFYQVETPEGIRYTRNGSFTLDSEGQIITMQGHPVVGAGAVPAGTVVLSVADDGRVLADRVEIGRLELVEFEDKNVLIKQGNNYYNVKDEGLAGDPAENTTVHQGYLEQSNVDPVMESINLIDTLRMYEAFQKVMLSFQEADQKTINEVGRLA